MGVDCQEIGRFRGAECFSVRLVKRVWTGQVAMVIEGIVVPPRITGVCSRRGKERKVNIKVEGSLWPAHLVWSV